MVDLDFTCLELRPQRYAAAPTLQMRLRINAPDGASVHALALRSQIQIEPHRRAYTDVEAELLAHLFGDRSRWADTLRAVPWTEVSTVVGPFTGATEVDIPVPCSYDLEVAAGKYLHALAGGEVSLLLLFSGIVFRQHGSALQVEPVPWACEATYQFPVRVWRELMEQYFPGGGWLRLRRETLDALLRYTAAQAFTDSDSALQALLTTEPMAKVRP